MGATMGMKPVTLMSPRSSICKYKCGATFILLINIYLCVLGQPVNATDWPMSGGNPQHTNSTPDQVAPPLTEAWEQSFAGRTFSSPVVVGQTLFAMSYNGSYQRSVVCIDLQTKTLRWETPVSAYSYYGVTASSGNLYVSEYYSLSALDATNGQLKWRFSPGVLTPSGFFNRAMAPVVADDRVYIGVDRAGALMSPGGAIVALDTSTGAMAWQQQIGGYPHTAPTLWQDKAYLATSSHWEGGVYISEPGAMAGVSNMTGSVMWKRGWEGWNEIVASNNMLYALSNGILGAPNTLACLDPNSGNSNWSSSTLNIASIYATYPGYIFCGSNSALLGLNADTGVPVWQIPMTQGGPDVGGQSVSSLIAAGGTLWMLWNEGSMSVPTKTTLKALEPSTGNILAELAVDSGASSVIVANQILYLISNTWNGNQSVTKITAFSGSARPWNKSVTIAPATASVVSGGTAQFAAKAYKADGTLDTNPSLTWSVVSGGTITQSGLFTAGTLTGTFLNTVNVTYGSASDTATVTVGGGGGGGTPPTEKPKVVLIRGTWNSTIYSDLRETLKSLGYKDDIDETNLDGTRSDDDVIEVFISKAEGRQFFQTYRLFNGDIGTIDMPEKDGAASIPNCSSYIRRRIKELLGPGTQYPIDVDIIAHSAGGLAARYIIRQSNEVPDDTNSPPRRMFHVHNLITLGTPYGGIIGTRVMVAKKKVGGPLVDAMEPYNAVGNRWYYPNAKLNGREGETYFDSRYMNGFSTTYWGLGGTTSRYPDGTLIDEEGTWRRDYSLAGISEPADFDGYVSVSSALGQYPKKNTNPPCNENFRFFQVNHSTLPRNATCRELIGKVLLGQSWPSCVDAGGPSPPRSAPPGNSQLVELTDLILSPNVSKAVSLPIDTCTDATFILTSQVACQFVLTTPDGSQVTQTDTNRDVVYEEGEQDGTHYYIFTASNPMVGNWTAKVTPTGSIAQGEPAGLTVAVTNRLSFEGASIETEYANGGSPHLQATAAENGAPRTNASVQAYITAGGADVILKALLDDGGSGDGQSNDGVYGGYLAPVREGGAYNVNLKATGTNTAGEQFQRVAFSFFTIAPKSATLTRSYTDAGVDNDADGVFEFLEVQAGVNVTEAGTFLVEGDLTDGTGEVIDSALGAGSNLTTGNGTVPLLFDGNLILKHGQDGPFKVKNLRLYMEKDGRPIWMEDDADGYTTLAYTVSQFDHPPIVQVLQPDSTNPTANTSFNIILQATDEDTPAAVDVYYDTDNTGADGVLIASNLTADGQKTVTWDTSLLAAGSYYIYAVANDGIRPPVTAYSAGVVRVQRAPTLTGITPNSGLNNSPVSITNLAGTGFLTGATVKLTRTDQPEIAAISVVVLSSTQITCTFDLTGKAVGAWNVVVTNPDTQSGTLADGFTIGYPAPTVIGITPNSGTNDGAVNITNLAGTGFLAGATVKLTRTGETDISGTTVSVVSSTQITCTFDLTGKVVGAWNVVVTNPDNQSGTLANGFTINQATIHDVALAAFSASPTSVSRRQRVTFSYTVKNNGNVTETNFTFRLTYNGQPVGQPKTIASLAAGQQTSGTIRIKVPRRQKVGDYLITGTVSTVTGETNTANNSQTVKVTVK